jgi:DNA polymerase III subunit alpha
MHPMNDKFIHLHCHTEFSLLEGALRISRLLDVCQEQEISSVALTDNGSMYGAMEFYLKAKEKNLNPIIGCEMYLTPDISVKERNWDRLILLCKDFKGYQNLIQLVTISNLEGFYYKPRIDIAHLEKNAEGLIAISPGRYGPVANTIRMNEKQANETAEKLKQIYKDDFYLGIQKLGDQFEDIIIEKSCKLSKDLNIPVVATNDVYYETRDKAYLKNILSCIKMGKRIEDDTRINFQSKENSFKTSEEMIALFKDIPDAISNTVKIAEKCNLEIETDRVLLPKFECPDGLAPKDYLEKLIWEGIKDKYGDVTAEIQERVDFELSIINKMNYAIYFLIIYDFLNYAYESKIPVGPGRGSAAGSIVAYALHITNIDPLRYNLLFERFLNPERISMPDIDLDFCIRRRGEIINYIIEKYGEECVSQIITFGSMASRGVVRDVGRVLDVPLNEVDYIAKLIPSIPGVKTGIRDALEEVPDLKKAYDSSKEKKELLDIGMELEGFARHTSTHAAGVVISRDPLYTVVPLVKNDGQMATQYPMNDLEKIGLLKMDILGLRNLTVMKDALALIKETRNVDIDLDNLDLTDKPTYDLLCAGDTVGVFQLESRGMRALIKNLHPQVFEDIIALLALYRPGPLGSGMVNDFISNKKGETTVKYDLPELEPILEETYGLIVYQEQVMQIASVIGGFTLGEADMLRRAMGKKKKSVMDKMRQQFLDGASDKNFPLKKAERIFELCYKFAEYGFNKSHSAAYAMISFQTAFLKANYPEEYMTALLSSVINVTDKAALYIQDTQKMGIHVHEPDINESVHSFSLTDKEPKKNQGKDTGSKEEKPKIINDKIKYGIRFGLGAIKNVGEGAIESIVKNRTEEGPYKNLMDFCLRVDLKQVNKRVVESLIKSGAADALGDRSYLLAVFEHTLESAQITAKEKSNGQESLFSAIKGNNNPLEMRQVTDYPLLTYQEKLKLERDMLGLYISGHPLNEYKDKLDSLKHKIDGLSAVDVDSVVKIGGLITDTRKIITRSKREMIIGTLEDTTGTISVLVFSDKNFEANSAKFQEGNIVFLNGKVRMNQDEISLICEDLDVINQLDSIKKLYIDLENADPEVFGLIKGLSQKYRGTLPLHLVVGETNILAHQKYWLNADDLCMSQLENIVGSGRIWIM